MLDILIVEDDAASRKALTEWLGRQGMNCRTACDLASARLAVMEDAPDLALIDLELPDGSGLQLLSVLGRLPDTDVVMISGKTTIESAIEALRLGARDFLTKPVALPRLTELIARFSVSATRRHELRRVRHELEHVGRFGDLVGVSPAMRKVYGAVERVAPTDETVFVIGPTGTGKELVAAMVYRLSLRASSPFVALNCGSLSAGLIESELFGHERGSFTGAHKLHHGVFERAQGGTLFLDEVTEMPPDLQVRLLRVLESGKLTRVGGSAEIEIDVRIIASTNRDPHLAVEEGALRQDLLYRLHVFPLRLPPLVERGGDIRLLAESFLCELNEELHVGKTLSPAALEALEGWSWPGNVRELRNVVRRAWIMAGDVIDVGDVVLGESPVSQALPQAEFTLRAGTSIQSAEKQLIEATLAHLGGDKRKAAGLLGISLKTLYTRLGLYAAGA